MNKGWTSGIGSSTIFDELEDLFDGLIDVGIHTVNKLPQAIISSTFPPSNMYEGEDGSLVYEAALAGWKREEIEITIEGRNLVLTLTPKDRPERVYVQKGIKDSKSVTKYFVSDRFDPTKLQAKFKDGL